MPKSAKVSPLMSPSNQVHVSIGDDRVPSLIVNGMELANAITPDWSITVEEDDGLRQAFLTVTFPVVMP